MLKARVPTSVTLKDSITGKTGQTLSFKEYAYSHWFTDNRWVTPLTNIDIFLKVKKEVDKPEGADMNFEDADQTLFAEIVRTVPHEPPLIYLQVKKFDDAILCAGAHPDTTAK